jgi:ABC-type amino acid transport substrate-binding protein
MLKLLVAALLGGLIALGITKAVETHPTTETTTVQQSAFDRVLASHTLRCAYAPYDPFLIIGTDSSIKGIFHDIVEEAGKRLNLKIVWAEEVGYGNINTGFMTGRYDAFCAGLWPAGSRAASTLFSRAVAWEPVSVWVRGNDTRFDGHMDVLNNSLYKLADMVDALFPKAERAFITQGQTVAEEMLEVTSYKADALFSDYISVDKFLKNSPNSLKDLSPAKPPLIYALTIGYNQHEEALKNMFDVVLDDMERDGTIGHVVKTYLGDKSGMLFHQQNQFAPY